MLSQALSLKEETLLLSSELTGIKATVSHPACWRHPTSKLPPSAAQPFLPDDPDMIYIQRKENVWLPGGGDAQEKRDQPKHGL